MIEKVDFGPLLRGEQRSFKFEGSGHGDLAFSFFVINYLAPGTGPDLHVHPYAEVFVTLQGEALFTVGEETLEVSAGEIVVAPAHVPHKFVSVGTVPLIQVDIHDHGVMVQEDLVGTG